MPAIKKKSPSEWRRESLQYAFPEYNDLVEYRMRVDDCLQGQKNIKRKAIYLPPTKWQEEHTEEYHAFLQRALFYSMTTYAMRIYEGLTMSGFPEIILAEDGKMDFILRSATVHHRDLHSLQSNLNREQFSHGLRCMLVDPTDNPQYPFVIKEYCANSFLRAYFDSNSGDSKARMVLLDESGYDYDLKTKQDVYAPRFLVLGLDANNEYYQCNISPADWVQFDIYNPPKDARTTYPTYRGIRISQIPFTWCGASSLSGVSMDMPPLLDMADCEIKLFQLDAQYSQHIFQSCQETMFFLNASSDFKLESVRYGSGAHNKLPKGVEPKVISNNGVGFTAQKEYMDSIIAQIELRRMSIMSSKSHQSGTAVGIVQNAQTAPLRTIVDTSGDAISEQLRFIALWMGYPDKEIARVRYTPSKDFANVDSNLSEFVALCQAVTRDEVPMLSEDLYRMAKENGYVNSRIEWKEFKKRWALEKLERQDSLGYIPQSKKGILGDPQPFGEKNTDDGNVPQDGKNAAAKPAG